jgi:hypothetical protein
MRISIMGRGYYILSGKKDGDLTEAAGIIRNQFEIS